MPERGPLLAGSIGASRKPSDKGGYLFRVRASVLLCAGAFAFGAGAAWAGPVCLAVPAALEAGDGGIGGTGQIAASGSPVGGIGGTGRGAGGIGGTGAPQDPGGGIGGTGRSGGGIGGTGQIARDDGARGSGGIGGTGIVGTITGFASVCVNGLEVHYGAATPASENGRAGSLENLAVGQVVAIEAVPTERGLVAREIRMINALEGPVTAIDHGRGHLQVMGQNVVLSPGLAKQLGKVQVGTPVLISGLVNPAGHVVASRIQVKPDLPQATLIGSVVAGKVHGVPVQGNVPASAEVMASGKWNGHQLVATNVKADPVLPNRNTLARAVVEGYVQKDAGGHATLAGFELNGAPASVASHKGPVVVSGKLGGGHRLQVESVESVTRGAGDGVQFSAAAVSGVAVGNDALTTNTAPTSGAAVSTSVATTPVMTRERTDRAEKTEKVERVEKAEKVEKVDKIEKVEKPEKVDRPDKVEKPEKIDRAERPQRSERPERYERH